MGLDAVAALPSVRTAAGDAPSHLYLFEQVTRLDSLVLDSASAPKRNRTRHQHFWRNRYPHPSSPTIHPRRSLELLHSHAQMASHLTVPVMSVWKDHNNVSGMLLKELDSIPGCSQMQGSCAELRLEDPLLALWCAGRACSCLHCVASLRHTRQPGSFRV